MTERRLSFIAGGGAADYDLMLGARAGKERRAEGERAVRAEAKPQTIVLVACAKKKRKAEAAAEDLYTSALFRKARQYAERRAARWFILSALHGLVEPKVVLKPYNVTLRSYRKKEREEWAQAKVLPALLSQAPEGSRIVILAGRIYFEHLEPELVRRGYRVEIPMRGMDIYEMLRFLKSKNGQ